MPLAPKVSVRRLEERDLDVADTVVRTAFGTLWNLPEPSKAFGDREMLRNRWRASPSSAFAAFVDGELVGVNLATRWGSYAFFGPLAVRPDLWDKGIGGKLVEPVMRLFSKWDISHASLFTFADSPKHVGLYHKFGFHARFLTQVMVKKAGKTTTTGSDLVLLSSFGERHQRRVLADCRQLTGRLYPGLDLTNEILASMRERLGETVLIFDESTVRGFAICHIGAGTEAGSGRLFVKFGAVRPGVDSPTALRGLLDACEAVGGERGVKTLEVGVNLARSKAYEVILDGGFRADFQGVVMDKPNSPAYNRPDVYVVDDLR